ncbi:hypothetical protein MUK70_11645 [Dyadobacter chenwenxiniae]|uniref:Uncharacterized protein n=1 Tax=Dyadobacter chenwenxiniae TaxID=2906456 RepID=A0A9X1TJB7_9BACT|nr:hypothetical protein [Dyadobacter chenwenxiniae]MCF0059893.1 hypothetical protein [Dyadobacter chenwenxiniae]UON85633.1 hypothetical protein MUK70_11645 [Dyadobacter chenwenxiniae]
MRTANDYFYQAYKQYKAWCKENGFNHKEMHGKFAEFAGLAMKEYAAEVTNRTLSRAADEATKELGDGVCFFTGKERIKNTEIITP